MSKTYIGPIFVSAILASLASIDKSIKLPTDPEQRFHQALRVILGKEIVITTPEDLNQAQSHVDEINNLFLEEKFQCELAPNKNVFIYNDTKSKGFWCEGLNIDDIKKLKNLLTKHHLIIPRTVIASLGVVEQKSIPQIKNVLQKFYLDAIKPKTSEIKDSSLLSLASTSIGKVFSSDVTKTPEFNCALIYGKDGNVCLVASNSILDTLISSLPKPQKIPMSQAIAIYNAVVKNSEFESTKAPISTDQLKNAFEILHMTCNVSVDNDEKTFLITAVTAEQKKIQSYGEQLIINPGMMRALGFDAKKGPGSERAAIEGFCSSKKIPIDKQYTLLASKSGHFCLITEAAIIFQIEQFLPKPQQLTLPEAFAIINYSEMKSSDLENPPIKPLANLSAHDLLAALKSLKIVAHINEENLEITAVETESKKLAAIYDHHLLALESKAFENFPLEQKQDDLQSEDLQKAIIGQVLGHTDFQIFQEPLTIFVKNKEDLDKIKEFNVGVSWIPISTRLIDILKVFSKENPVALNMFVPKIIRSLMNDNDAKIECMTSLKPNCAFEISIPLKHKALVLKKLDEIVRQHSLLVTPQIADAIKFQAGVKELASALQMLITKNQINTGAFIYIDNSRKYIVLGQEDIIKVQSWVRHSLEISTVHRLAVKLAFVSYGCTSLDFQNCCGTMGISAEFSSTPKPSIKANLTNLTALNNEIKNYVVIPGHVMNFIKRIKNDKFAYEQVDNNTFVISLEMLKARYELIDPLYISSHSKNVMENPWIYDRNKACDQSELQLIGDDFKPIEFMPLGDKIKKWKSVIGYVPLEYKPIKLLVPSVNPLVPSVNPQVKDEKYLAPIPPVSKNPYSLSGSSSSSSSSSISSSSTQSTNNVQCGGN